MFTHIKNRPELWYDEGQAGYITLLSVLVFGAVGIAVTLALIQSGIGSSRTGFTVDQSARARAAANACAEEALQQIWNSSSYTGNGNLTLPTATCVYTVTNSGGVRTIYASGSVQTTIRKIRVIINSINPQIQIASWQEVADF